MSAPTTLTLHIGQDYAVAMLPDETTDTATVVFGRCQDQKSRNAAEAFVRRFNSQPALIAALEACVEEMKNTSAWEDAIKGDDRAMLDAVNDAEHQIALANGTPFTPHEVEDCGNFQSDGRGCCRNCNNFHGPVSA